MSEAKRGVVYTLKVQSDESVNRELHAFGERGQQLQAMFGNIKLGGLDLAQFQTSVDRAHASVDTLQKRALSPVNLTAYSTSAVATARSPIGGGSLPTSGGPEPTLPAAAETKAPVDPIGNIEKLKGSLDKVVADSKAAEAKITANAAAEAEKQTKLPDNVVQARMKMVARIQQFEEAKAAAQRSEAQAEIARLQKVADAEAKAADKQAAANAKEVDRYLADQDKAANAKEKAEEKKIAAGNKALAALIKSGADAQKQDEAAKEKAEAAEERVANKTIGLNIRLRRSLGEVAASSTELLRGFVELGLVGEEDMEKIKDGILQVQSAVDLVRGGIGVWNALAESAHLYQERLEMVAKAEKLAAAARGASAVSAAGAAGAAGGGISGAAAIGGLVAAINPVTLVLGAFAAVAIGATIALNKYTESVKEAEKQAAESRKKELEAREAQNAQLQQTFAKERQARDRASAREALALKESQEFGEKRSQYEAEAGKLGLKGQGRERDVTNQAAIDQTRLALEQVEKELTETAKQPDRSREMAVQQSPEDQARLAEINKKLTANAEEMGGTLAKLFKPGENSGIVQERKALERERDEIQRRSAAGRFAASPEIESESKEKTEELEHRRNELELQLREQEQARFRDQAAAINEELQGQQQLIEGDKERLKTAVEYAKQTNDAYHSALAGFGHLSKAKQQRAIGIQQKLDEGKGHELSDKDLEFAEQNLGKRGKKQVQEEFENRVDPRARGIFSAEDEERGKGAEGVGKAMGDVVTHLKELAQTMARAQQLEARSVGGEKATIKVDAKNHASLEIKWAEDTSEMVAKAIQPELAKWQQAIQGMLDTAKAEIEQTFKRTLQRKSQTTAAGA